jgi:hypothetical protein
VLISSSSLTAMAFSGSPGAISALPHFFHFFALDFFSAVGFLGFLALGFFAGLSAG